MKSTKAVSKAARTRGFIIEKAAPVFNKKGYVGTSLTDLLAATKLTKGSLYGNFENKDEIALAAFEYNFNVLKRGLLNAIGSKENTIDKLLSITKYYRTECHDLFARGGCPILNAAADADDHIPLLHKKTQSSLRELKGLIESIISSGINTKEIKPKVDAEKYAVTVISLIEGGIMIAKTLSKSAYFFTSLERIDFIITEELKA